MADWLTYYKKQLVSIPQTPPLIAGGGDTLSNDIVLDSVQNDLVLTVTEEQYVQLLSSALNGVYTTYPEDYLEVIYPLIKAAKTMLCDKILECIETTPELQQAIGRFSLTSGITDTTTEDSDILDTDFTQGQPNCDNDKLFGMCRQLANFLNQTSEDILELFVTAFSTPARLGDLIEAIPVVGSLPLDDVLQFMEKMSETINDAYQAAYDTQMNEDISCLFFCAAKDTCSLTFEQARDEIYANINNPTSGQDFVTMINDIIANNYIGEQSVWLMHYFILQTLIFGGEILGQNADRMVITIATYFNDPDADWLLLCDCVIPWTTTLDFTVSDYGITWLLDSNSDPIGQFVSGLGLTTTDVVYGGNDQRWLRGSIAFDATTMTDIQVIGSFTKGYSGGQQGLTALNNTVSYQSVDAGFSTRLNYSDFVLSQTTNVDVSDSGDTDADEIIISWRPNLQAHSGGATVTSMILSGTGTKPAQFP